MSNIIYDNLIYCFVYGVKSYEDKDEDEEDEIVNINLKKDLLKRYQITETFNALKEKLKLKNIPIEDFLKNDIETLIYRKYHYDYLEDDYKLFICKNNKDCEIIEEIENEEEHVFKKYNKRYNKINNLEKVVSFRTNHKLISCMKFSYNCAIGVVNDILCNYYDNIIFLMNNDDKDYSFYNESELKIFFVCVDIRLNEYNKMILEKCLKNKNNEELVEKYKNKVILNKELFINNCYTKYYGR